MLAVRDQSIRLPCFMDGESEALGGFRSDLPKAVKGSGVDRAGTGLVSSRPRDYLTAHTMLWDLM